MTTQADLVISALQTGHEQLAPVVAALTPEQLTTETAPGEWDVSQVISHLGSGAVITLNTVEKALTGESGGPSNQEIWAVWDGLGPVERQERFAGVSEALLARLAAIDESTRESLRIDMGFLPEPVDLATALRFRLGEAALHSWDVRAFVDPAAVVHPDAVPLLLDQIGFMLGFVAKPDRLGRDLALRIDLSDPERSIGLTLGEKAALGDPPAEPDAVLSISAEAWERLATGRLKTDGAATITGDASLDDLRTVFPGF